MLILDVQTLLNYSPEHGALRMWPEMYDRCVAEVSRLTWGECPDRVAVLERLCVRTSRLFVFAHRLLAAYRRRLGEATSTSSLASEVVVVVVGVGVGGGGGDDDEGVDRLKERLREAFADLVVERAGGEGGVGGGARNHSRAGRANPFCFYDVVFSIVYNVSYTRSKSADGKRMVYTPTSGWCTYCRVSTRRVTHRVVLSAALIYHRRAVATKNVLSPILSLV